MSQSIYAAVGGDAALLRLARAWHARCVADDVVGHAFSCGVHPDHVRRLATYWGEALGGPTTYSDSMGDESSVVRLHSGNGEHQEMDERALRLFIVALDDADISCDRKLRATLTDYFQRSLREMGAFPTSRDDVPHDLKLRTFSWTDT